MNSTNYRKKERSLFAHSANSNDNMLILAPKFRFLFEEDLNFKYENARNVLEVIAFLQFAHCDKSYLHLKPNCTRDDNVHT